MSKLLILNWKMNPATLKEALDLAKASDREDIVIAPPFLFLEEVGKILRKANLGAQDLFWENPPSGGAFTGEVSAKELKNIGVKYVIIGHSERRQKLGETDEMIAKKMKIAIESGLAPILCVGETKQERKAGKKEKILKNQLEADLCLIAKRRYALNVLFIAYEPIWAIGTGKPESPESALETIKYIKSLIAKRYTLYARVLYGGSVSSKNLGDYIKYKEIGGALVGGASLKKEEIKKIINAAKI